MMAKHDQQVVALNAKMNKEDKLSLSYLDLGLTLSGPRGEKMPLGVLQGNSHGQSYSNHYMFKGGQVIAAWDANNKVSHHGVENYVGCAYLSIEVHPTKGKSIELSAEAIILVEQPRGEKAKAIPHTKTGEISMNGNAIFRGFEITIGSEKWTVSKA